MNTSNGLIRRDPMTFGNRESSGGKSDGRSGRIQNGWNTNAKIRVAEEKLRKLGAKTEN